MTQSHHKQFTNVNQARESTFVPFFNVHLIVFPCKHQKFGGWMSHWPMKSTLKVGVDTDRGADQTVDTQVSLANRITSMSE